MKKLLRSLPSQLLLTILTACSLVLTPGLFDALPASAITGGDWRAGRIIDDSVFYNKNTMSAQQIQQFLNGKMPNCDTNGSQPSEYGGGTRAQYGAAHGGSGPYTCLKDFREGSRSAAQIIYDAGQQYSINPQVLLAIMQREQALITDDWPWTIQYTYAMGYGCPDTGPNHAINCSGYEGFTNQVDKAAWQLRLYANNPNDYNFVPGRNNTVQWSPQPSCGSSSVYITNQPTASLYNYAPYQPNQAALDNLYGTGDSCSAYANRNFWRYFNDWFGSGLGGPFNWAVTNLYIMDEGKNVDMSTDRLHRGERLFVVVKGKNTGTETWYKDGIGPNPARLGTWESPSHPSVFCDLQWLRLSERCSRAASMNEDAVPPGGTFHFETYVHAPAQGGQFREYFNPVLEGRAWMTNELGFHVYVNSTDYFDWGWGSFGAWTNQTKSTPSNLDNLAAGEQVYIELKAKNTTATVWSQTGENTIHLGTSMPQDRTSAVCMPSWLTCTRPAGLQEATVAPGQTGTFAFTLKAPTTIGAYREYFKPILEQKGWMRDDYNHIYLNVTH